MSQYAKTRIKHKHDIEANWSISNIMPLDGEIIIYDPDDTHATPRFKVGDGKTALNDLPFVSNGESGGGGSSPQGEIYTLAEKNKLKNLPTNGIDNVVSNNGSIAFGEGNTATGNNSQAVGIGTTASGVGSHAEGLDTTASKEGSHAEGFGTYATGNYSHAEGVDTTASEDFSHAEGWGTIANSQAQHVQGRFNKADADKAHIVGGGDSVFDEDRKNIHTIDWDGNAWFAGDIRVGGSSYDDASPLCTQDDISEKQNTSNELTIIPGDAEWKEISLDGKTQHYYLELEGFIDETNEMVDTVEGVIYIFCNDLKKDEHTFYLYINVSCEKFVTLAIYLEHETEEGDPFIPSVTWIEEPTIDYSNTKLLLAFKTIDGGKSWVANQCYSMEVTN